MGKFSIKALFSGEDKGVGRIISKIEGRLSRFAKGATVGFGSSMKKVLGAVGAGVVGAGIAVAGAATTAAIALKDVIETGVDFEKTMIGAAAKFSPAFRQGTAEFAKLEAAAKKIGETTEFSASQGAAGLKDLASAGFTSTQAIAALPRIVDLATAAEIELDAASNIAAKSLGAFGLMSDDAAQLGANLTRITDVMARTADATASSMEGLFETIQEGAPVAKAAGVSLETFMALAGQLSQSGIEASVAGTTLKNAMLILAAPTGTAAKALKKLGIQTKDSKGNMRDIIDVLGELQTKTAKMGTGQKAGVLEEIFGKIPIAGVTSLLDAGSEKLRGLRGELEKSGGSTARMAGIMRDATAGDLKNFSSAIESVKLAVFDVVKGPLKDVVRSVTEWMRANKELIAASIKSFLDTMIEGATFVRDNWGTIAPILKGIAIVIGVLVAGATLLFAPFYAVVVVVGLLIGKLVEFGAWVISLKGFWSAFGSFFVGLWEMIKGVFVGVVEFLVGLATLWVGTYMSLWSPFAPFFSGLWEGIKSIFSGAWDFIVAAAFVVRDAFMAVWAPLAGFFSGLWQGIVDTFNTVVGPIVKVIGGVIDKVRSIGRGTLGTETAEGESPAPGAVPGTTPQKQVIAPGERVAKSISESTTRGEVTVKATKGTEAKVSKPMRGPGVGLRVSPSGAF
jgi:TP901 family phage tail tape measure protein